MARDLTHALDEGRVVRALRLSSRPPESRRHARSGVDLASRRERGASLTADAPADRWAAVLDATAFSPVRLTVTPQSPPETPSDELIASSKKLASRLPQVAARRSASKSPTRRVHAVVAGRFRLPHRSTAAGARAARSAGGRGSRRSRTTEPEAVEPEAVEPEAVEPDAVEPASAEVNQEVEGSSRTRSPATADARGFPSGEREPTAHVERAAAIVFRVTDEDHLCGALRARRARDRAPSAR